MAEFKVKRVNHLPKEARASIVNMIDSLEKQQDDWREFGLDKLKVNQISPDMGGVYVHLTMGWLPSSQQYCNQIWNDSSTQGYTYIIQDGPNPNN